MKSKSDLQLFECDTCHIQKAGGAGMPEGWFQWEFRIYARLQATQILPRPFKGNTEGLHESNPSQHFCSIECAVNKIDADMSNVEVFADTIGTILAEIKKQQMKEERVAKPEILPVATDKDWQDWVNAEGEANGKDE